MSRPKITRYQANTRKLLLATKRMSQCTQASALKNAKMVPTANSGMSPALSRSRLFQVS